MHKIKSKTTKSGGKAKAVSKPAIAAKTEAAATRIAAQTVLNVKLPEGHRRLLNIVNLGMKLPRQFVHPQIHEVRFGNEPDVHIPGTLYDLAMIPDHSFDFIWNSNSLNHLHAHEVPGVLEHMHRIIRPGGQLFLTVPDLQRVAQHVAQGRLERMLYKSPAGPITALDILFGHTTSIAQGDLKMKVNTGFVPVTIASKLTRAGFGDVEVKREAFSLHVNARRVVARPADKPRIQYIDEETNRIMRQRDEIDRPPEIWNVDLSVLKK